MSRQLHGYRLVLAWVQAVALGTLLTFCLASVATDIGLPVVSDMTAILVGPFVPTLLVAGSALIPARHWIHLPSGALALELTYSGPFAPDDSTLVHELTVVKRGSHGVVFDTWGRPDLLTGAQRDLQRMIDDAAVA